MTTWLYAIWMSWLYIAGVIVIVVYLGRRRSVSEEEGDNNEEDGIDQADEDGNDLVAIKVEKPTPDNTDAEVEHSQSLSDSELLHVDRTYRRRRSSTPDIRETAV